MVSINVNQKDYQLDVDSNTPLLWVLRDTLNLVGTKYGCGIGQCGACTVHFNGVAVRSCSLPVSVAANAKIVTIEGISDNGDHPVQKAWEKLDVPQCGYCQSGQIMSAISLLSQTKSPTDQNIEDSMTNICRCCTYNKIKEAVKTAAAEM